MLTQIWRIVIARAIAQSNLLNTNVLDCFLLRASQFTMTKKRTFKTAPKKRIANYMQNCHRTTTLSLLKKISEKYLIFRKMMYFCTIKF